MPAGADGGLAGVAALGEVGVGEPVALGVAQQVVGHGVEVLVARAARGAVRPAGAAGRRTTGRSRSRSADPVDAPPAGERLGDRVDARRGRAAQLLGRARPSSSVERRGRHRSRSVPSSRLRSALLNASLKVRPIAMTSPTDFIFVVSVSSVPANFSNANRGTLTTT